MNVACALLQILNLYVIVLCTLSNCKEELIVQKYDTKKILIVEPPKIIFSLLFFVYYNQILSWEDIPVTLLAWTCAYLFLEYFYKKYGVVCISLWFAFHLFFLYSLFLLSWLFPFSRKNKMDILKNDGTGQSYRFNVKIE